MLKRFFVGLFLLAFATVLIGSVTIIFVMFLAPIFDQPSDQQPPTVGEPPTPAAIGSGEIPADAVAATVHYVHDGDTLFLTDGTKVRLLAVDTPEVGENAECYGDEATAYLRQLLPEGTTIYTEMDVEATDQYGRSLLFIWLSTGELVNLSLVEQGFAEAVFIGANRLHEAEVEAAEDAAQEAGRGMWGAC